MQYRYVGNDKLLMNETAMGHVKDGVFKVQVDQFIHPWSHGWHETPRSDWREIPGAFSAAEIMEQAGVPNMLKDRPLNLRVSK